MSVTRIWPIIADLRPRIREGRGLLPDVVPCGPIERPWDASRKAIGASGETVRLTEKLYESSFASLRGGINCLSMHSSFRAGGATLRTFRLPICEGTV